VSAVPSASRKLRARVLALGCALLAGCDTGLVRPPQQLTVRLSGPSEVQGIFNPTTRQLECSALLLIQASGDGFATWVEARKSIRQGSSSRSEVLTPGELQVIFATDMIQAGEEYTGQIYGQGTGTFEVDLVLSYQTTIEGEDGPLREAAYGYTCRAPAG
jgi:hypothetical protein